MSKKNKPENKTKRRNDKAKKPEPEYKSTMDYAFDRMIKQAPVRLKSNKTND